MVRRNVLMSIKENHGNDLKNGVYFINVSNLY